MISSVSRLATLLALLPVVMSAQAEGPRFDVASIKRNISGDAPHYLPPTIRPGQFSVINMTMKEIIAFGYPLQTQPADIAGLPDWAKADGYDVVTKLKSGATKEEQQEMWRALLADRLHLQAHYENRDRAAYHLVVTRNDRRLGPQLQPSQLDCTTPGPPTVNGRGADARINMSMQRCGIGLVGTPQGTGMYSGGTTLVDLARMLTYEAGRPVEDRTGLEGRYAIRLTFASEGQRSLRGELSITGDEPVLFTALQEQLGLKLVPATVKGQVLVIDRIERPSDN